MRACSCPCMATLQATMLILFKRDFERSATLCRSCRCQLAYTSQLEYHNDMFHLIRLMSSRCGTCTFARQRKHCRTVMCMSYVCRSRLDVRVLLAIRVCAAKDPRPVLRDIRLRGHVRAAAEGGCRGIYRRLLRGLWPRGPEAISYAMCAPAPPAAACMMRTATARSGGYWYVFMSRSNRCTCCHETVLMQLCN